MFDFEKGAEGFSSPHAWIARDGVYGPADPKLAEPVLSPSLYDPASIQNGTLSVKIRAVSGEIDQAGGIVFRARDANHYYVARVNVLEGNVRLYAVRRGIRRQIRAAEVKVDAGVWAILRVEIRGRTIAVSFDGKEVLKVEDDSYPDAGKFGLWSKADSAVQFDDFSVEPLK